MIVICIILGVAVFNYWLLKQPARTVLALRKENKALRSQIRDMQREIDHLNHIL